MSVHFIDTIITTEEASGQRRDKTEQKWKMAKQMTLLRCVAPHKERHIAQSADNKISCTPQAYTHGTLQKERVGTVDGVLGGRYRARKIWVDGVTE